MSDMHTANYCITLMTLKQRVVVDLSIYAMVLLVTYYCSVLVASIVLICKSLWIKGSGKRLNVSVCYYRQKVEEKQTDIRMFMTVTLCFKSLITTKKTSEIKVLLHCQINLG